MLENKSLTKCSVLSCLSLFSLLTILLFVKPMAAQSTASINFKIDNETMSSALFKLAYVADINFSYDAGDSLFNAKISYSATDKQPLVILDEILDGTNHTFKQVGNQVVIYKNNKATPVPILPIVSVAENTPSEELVDVATTVNSDQIILVHDTIFVSDTIVEIRTDTILIKDTVFIVKEKPQKQPTQKLKEIPVDYFNPVELREHGWSAEVFYAPIASSFSLVRETNSLSVRNFSLGVEATKLLNRWNISGGVKLTHFAEKFNHSYSTSDGGYFVTDTLDEYYTVSQTDTTWYYVTDSTWKPIDNHEYNYNINNRIGYLEFVASVSYDYYTNRKLRLYAKVGIQAGVLIYSNGLAIPDADKPEGVDFANLKFSSMSYSALGSIGLKYRLNKSIDFNTELYYFRSFNDVVIDYPISKRISGIGLKLGLIYYF